MKKLIAYVSFLALFATGCTSDEPAPSPDSSIEINHPRSIRTSAEAKTLAQAIADARSGISRNGNYIPRKVKDVKAVLSTTTHARGNRDTLMYAVEYANNSGYALISAAKNGEPILAYTDKGTYDENNENPGFNYYLGKAKDYVRSLIDKPIISDSLYLDPSRPITLRSFIIDRINVEWGQYFPEGIYFPNGKCGCVQTAIVQAMSYLGTPTQLTLTYPGKNKTNVYLNWKELNNHKRSANTQVEWNNMQNQCTVSAEAHNNLARLCRELGYRNGAIFDPEGTGTPTENAISTLKQILSPDKVTELKYLDNYTSFYSELKSVNGIALLEGFDYKTLGHWVGHVWICDGGEQTTTRRKLIRYDGSIEIVETSTEYFHFNWGWCGKDNGYFYAGVFDNTKPTKEGSNSRYNFDFDVAYFIVSK